jgi:hypothetical protein
VVPMPVSSMKPSPIQSDPDTERNMIPIKTRVVACMPNPCRTPPIYVEVIFPCLIPNNNSVSGDLYDSADTP